MDQESSQIFSNPDMEVASVLAVNVSMSSGNIRHAKSGCQSLPTFTSSARSSSTTSETFIKQSPFRPATVLTNLTRGNIATVTPTVLQPQTVHQLAGQGEIEILKEILTDVNETDKHGFTPLMWACTYNQLRTVKYLIENGAEINFQAQNGENALAIASSKGHETVTSYLLNDSNCKINCVDDAGNDALIYAVNGNHIKCVKILLTQGINVCHRNIEGLSAFDVAVKLGHFEIQKELEDYFLSYFGGKI